MNLLQEVMKSYLQKILPNWTYFSSVALSIKNRTCNFQLIHQNEMEKRLELYNRYRQQSRLDNITVITVYNDKFTEARTQSSFQVTCNDMSLVIHFWHAPLRVHSTKRRHQFPEWAILSHVDCFRERLNDSRSCWIVFIHVV